MKRQDNWMLCQSDRLEDQKSEYYETNKLTEIVIFLVIEYMQYVKQMTDTNKRKLTNQCRKTFKLFS